MHDSLHQLRAVRRLAASLALPVTTLAAAGCWPGPDDVTAPGVHLRVEVREAFGEGVPGVALQLRGAAHASDSAHVHVTGRTGADGRANLGRIDGWSAFRLFATAPAGYTIAAGQEHPVTLFFHDGSTVFVLLARMP